MLTTLILAPALLATPAFEAPALTPTPFETFYTPALEPTPILPAVEPFRRLDDVHHDAPGPWYLRINAGGVTTADSDGPNEDVEFDEGWLAAVAIGKRLTSSDDGFGFSLELEGVFTQQDADDSTAIDDVATLAPYLNGIFDFRLSDSFSLYAGAGIGAAWMNVGTETDSVNDFDDEDGPFLTWQAKAGVMWHVSPYTSLTLGYRFRNIDDNQIENDFDNSSFDLETEQHVLEAGIQFGW